MFTGDETSVERATPGLLATARNLLPEISTNVVAGIRAIDMSWLGAESLHGPNLPPELNYYGVYFPSFSVFDVNGVDRDNTPLSFDASAGNRCAHCAYLAACKQLEGVEVPLGYKVVASVIFIAPDCQPLEPRTEDWPASATDDVGRISFSCATKKLPFQGSGCGKCGFPGHTRATCSRQRFYAKVGVEIEGRFLERSDVEDAVEESALTFNHDSSISSGRSDAEPLEIQTSPGSVAEQLRQLAQFYPDEADGSCGMHVHVSFAETDSLSSVCSPEFYEYFRARWEAWGRAEGLAQNSEFFRRLTGGNDFCMPNEPHSMLEPHHADRYLQLNFRAWDEHKTVECRLLPMFKDARLAYSALVELVTIYEDWLGRDCPDLFYAVDIGPGICDVSEATSYSLGEVDTSEFPGVVDTQTQEIVMLDLPPVEDGCVRMCLSRGQRNALDTIYRYGRSA